MQQEVIMSFHMCSRFLTRFNSRRSIAVRLFSYSVSTTKVTRIFSTFSKRIAGLAGILSVGLAASYTHSGYITNCESSEKDDAFAGTSAYPAIEPYQKGMLMVSDIHTIAYSVYGNPKGKPVLVVHGGPGGGTHPDMARYFDPSVYRIVLVDQRGCGESTPFAELRENTTYDIIRDFEQVRQILGIKKWQVFGGSWGSTLSLAYAIEHPDCVSELILRGVFLLREKELKWMYQGPGGSFIFPEDWAAYEAAIPEEERGDYIKAYGKRLRGEMGDEEMLKAAKAWSIWEGRISKLVQDPNFVRKFGGDRFALAFARIENHFFTNKGFFPRDGFLIEDENIKKIQHIPTVIVQGRYDVVCPAVAAYELNKKLLNSELVYAIAGHSAREPGIITELVKATDKFKYR